MSKLDDVVDGGKYLPVARWQMDAFDVYAGGDYAGREDLSDFSGDTLARFIFIETSPHEDCDSREEAIRRMTVARDELQQVIDALSIGDGGS